MMDRSRQLIPVLTIEILAKSFFRNSLHYGFRKIDYLRFINYLMDILIKDTAKFDTNTEIKITTDYLKHPYHSNQLPTDEHIVRFKKLGYQISFTEMDQLIPNEAKRRALHSAITVKKTSNINSEKLGHSKIATLITHHHNMSIRVIAYVYYDPAHQQAELIVYHDEEGKEKGAIKKEAVMDHVMTCLRHQGIWFSKNLYHYLNRTKSDA